MTITGALIAESLPKGVVFQDTSLTLEKVWRSDSGEKSAGQPLTWTFIEFSADDRLSDRLADALSGVLDPVGGWYCDFHTDDETFVCFSGRVFRYPRGDRAGRTEAEDYGRSKGVPEEQLDWPA